jgi:hypothetical protein
MGSTVYGDFLDVVPGRATSFEMEDDGRLRHRSSAITRGGLLRDDLRHEMWTAVRLADGSTFRLDGRTLGYGMGWIVDDRVGHRSVGHSGGDSSGFRSFVEDDLAILILHNGTADPEALIRGIAQILLPDPSL